MFDARHLLGTLLGTGMGGMNRRSGFPDAGRGARDEGGSGGFGGILESVGRLSGGGAGSGLATLGGLAGLLGVGGRLGRGAGLAALGGLALHALKNYQEQQGGPQSADVPEEAKAAAGTIGDEEAIVIVRAMVAAANADGRIDADEEQRIMGRLEQTGASAEEREFLHRELSNPVGVEEIAKAVRTPEFAQQVYGASLVAVTADTPAEQSYLRYLADRIGLDAQTRAAIHQQLGVPPLGG
jgi:uncharacterized membrane protein YebE (DUF533 family)